MSNNIEYVEFQPYKDPAPCIKCGGSFAETVYHKANEYEHYCSLNRAYVTKRWSEHLVFTCEKCGYEWTTKCKDAV